MTPTSDFDIALLNLLPKHEGELCITHNAHKCNYSTVEEEIDDEYYGTDDWVSEDERNKAVATNSLWTLHWYPNTPVGFCTLHASSLEAILSHLMESKVNVPDTDGEPLGG